MFSLSCPLLLHTIYIGMRGYICFGYTYKFVFIIAEHMGRARPSQARRNDELTCAIIHVCQHIEKAIKLCCAYSVKEGMEVGYAGLIEKRLKFKIMSCFF